MAGQRTCCQMVDYSTLPVEITEQIFVRVICVKSILRCMSVCKSWYASIKSPHFIEMHYERPNDKTEYLLCSGPNGIAIEHYDTDRLENYSKLNFYDSERKGLVTQGCCDGLICYTYEYYPDVYLFNPLIQRVKILPKSLFSSGINYFSACCGLWYDTQDEDYKVAKISDRGDKSIVEVYSLRTNSWDTITTSGPKGPDWRSSFCARVVHIKGKLYWLRLIFNKWMIVCLNPKDGMFRETFVSNDKYWLRLDSPRDHSSYLILIKMNWSYGLVTQYHTIHLYDKTLIEQYMIDATESKIKGYYVGTRSNRRILFQTNDDTIRQTLVRSDGELKFKVISYPERRYSWIRPFNPSLLLLNNKDSISTGNTKPVSK